MHFRGKTASGLLTRPGDSEHFADVDSLNSRRLMNNQELLNIDVITGLKLREAFYNHCRLQNRSKIDGTHGLLLYYFRRVALTFEYDKAWLVQAELLRRDPRGWNKSQWSSKRLWAQGRMARS